MQWFGHTGQRKLLADEVAMQVPWCVDKEQEEFVSPFGRVYEAPKCSGLLSVWLERRGLLLCLSFLQVKIHLEDPSLGCFGREVVACTETRRRGSCGKNSLMRTMAALCSSQREAQLGYCHHFKTFHF